jgi:hypothetical protein
MIAWALVQTNPSTNEQNITFVTEPVANVEDYAVSSGDWKNCPVEIIPVVITTLHPAKPAQLEQLMDRTYHSDGWVDAEEAALQQLIERAR